MKWFFGLLVIATILITENVCYRIKRQDDSFIFPNDEGSVPNQIAGTTPAPGTTTNAPTPPRTTPSPEFLQCMMNCPTTMEYNPVCGTNQVPYHNEQRLLCANRCGANVGIVRRGICRGAPFK